MTNKSREDGGGVDGRVVLLFILCLFILLHSWQRSRSSNDEKGSDGDYILYYTETGFSVKTGENDVSGAKKIPAGAAPFFFAKLDINEVDSELLQIIPGIGPHIAEKIISKRDELGLFTGEEQLLEVVGIGMKRKELLLRWLEF